MTARLALLCLLCLPAAALAQEAPAAAPPPTPAAAASPVPATPVPEAVPLEEIQRYVSVYRAIKDAYVEPLDDKTLMHAALRGLLSDLDPHSAYLERDEAEALSDQTRGAYDGIGIEVMQRPDRSILVVAPIDGTPAQRAGLRSGDVILAINGQSLDVDSADEASQTLRGEPGTQVRITVLSPGDESPRELVIQRETIRVQSVASRLLEPGYGYLRISTFQAETGPQVTRQLEALRAASDGRLAGVVLDLRSNPGGLLNAAVEAADAFLEDGVIVSTRGRLVYSNAEYRARPGDASGGADVVVLVDGGTASAAEVLAGALRDHDRALVMGSRTFGKGSVQTVVPLENGDSVKLTTARYYTPSGRSIQARGIRPDVRLRGKAATGPREQDLPGHLGGDDDDGDGDGDRPEGALAGEVIEGDEAIARALDRLKADRAARG